MCDTEKSKFIKEKRASGLLRSLSKIRYIRSSFVSIVLSKLIQGIK